MPKYIDTELLKRRIYEHRLFFVGQDADVMMMNDIIDEMPAADVEPVRHGSWISDKYAYEHCSLCGFEWDEAEYVSNFRDTVNYCPNCGAKMDGGDEE